MLHVKKEIFLSLHKKTAHNISQEKKWQNFGVALAYIAPLKVLKKGHSKVAILIQNRLLTLLFLAHF